MQGNNNLNLNCENSAEAELIAGVECACMRDVQTFEF
jgi:hypothetical protein